MGLWCKTWVKLGISVSQSNVHSPPCSFCKTFYMKLWPDKQNVLVFSFCLLMCSCMTVFINWGEIPTEALPRMPEHFLNYFLCCRSLCDAYSEFLPPVSTALYWWLFIDIECHYIFFLHSWVTPSIFTICPKVQSNVVSSTNVLSFRTTFFLDYFKGIYNKIKTILLFWIFPIPVQSLLVFGLLHCFFPHKPLGSFCGSI